MKKLPFKKFGKKKPTPTIPSRITNETVAEYRERILAGGRRFKYPIQYARHRVVVTAAIVVTASLILTLLVGWWQLYFAQNTSNFFYRITSVVPVPVASVEGKSVRYSDYLMRLNPSMHYLENSQQVDLGSSDGQRQLDYIKRQSLDIAIADAYALKLADQLDISVTDEQVDQVISKDRNTASGRISQDTYDASIFSELGWTPSEYRYDAKNKLIRQQVAYSIDETARQRQAQAAELLEAKDADFDEVADELGGEGASKVTTGVSGLVPQTNRDGGLSEAAATLEEGQISSAIRTTTGDGYYFVRLLDKTDNQVNYEFLRIPLQEFDQRLEKLRQDGKINEYISIPPVDSQPMKQ